MLKTYVINRLIDVRRREFILRQIEKHPVISAELVSAVDGHDPSFNVRDHFLKNCKPNLPTPENLLIRVILSIGLSHAKCWQKVLDGEEEYALIIEDDVIIEQALSKLLTDLEELGSFDLIFVNELMIVRRNLARAIELDNNQDFVSVDENYRLLRTNVPGQADSKHYSEQGKLRGVGGYGYILSKCGAKKLLLQFEKEDFAAKHIDNYMFFNGLSFDTIETIEPEAIVRQIQHRVKSREDVLDAYIYRETVVCERSGLVGGSVRPKLKPVVK